MSTGAVRRLGHERARTRNRLQPSLTGHGLEGRALYTELVPRLHEIELAGTPEYMQTLFVGGPKRLPIRYTIT
ncbi:hypothetical protein FRAHR75_250023 [Frankia sp. Hr75.2]|nr:hypothetical protein FRAHR75_250023 [Frankia sp. Hr75.2]